MNHSEDREQRALCDWLDKKQIIYCAVPNGGKRNMVEATMMKKSGVKAGVPDLLIFTPPPMIEARGVAIEMKSKTGRLSPAQGEWLERLRVCGWCVTVAYGWDEAREFLTGLGF